MTTRIYRQSPGRWVAVTRHPSGGVVRETYTSGRAALIALDGRNRERRVLPKERLFVPNGPTGEGSIEAIAGWGVSTSEFLDNMRTTFYRPAVWGKRDTGVIR